MVIVCQLNSLRCVPDLQVEVISLRKEHSYFEEGFEWWSLFQEITWIVYIQVRIYPRLAQSVFSSCFLSVFPKNQKNEFNGKSSNQKRDQAILSLMLMLFGCGLDSDFELEYTEWSKFYWVSVCEPSLPPSCITSLYA